MITPRAVASLLTCLEAHGISFWLDGGVGVDALVGGWTREHSDLDLVIPLAQAAEARRALGTLGMTHVIDLHTVTFDDEGGGTQELPGGRSFRYPPEGFAGVGWLEGRAWPCLTAEVQVRCHVGYDPDATDYHDMRLLHERFGVPLPAPYAGHGDRHDAGG
jgi:lincosamide nucleotidyltransferase A/C/D/E